MITEDPAGVGVAGGGAAGIVCRLVVGGDVDGVAVGEHGDAGGHDGVGGDSRERERRSWPWREPMAPELRAYSVSVAEVVPETT